MPEWLTDIPISFWEVLSEMAPYLLFGFFVAGLLSVLISPQRVERHLGGRGFWPVVKAAAFGVPLPLCSCGVIPVSASLRRHGASRAATTSFLISTPQTGVDSILVTWSLLGGVFAIYRPLAALVSGVLGGAAVSLTEPAASEGHAGHGAGGGQEHDDCHDECCQPGKHGKFIRAMSYGFITLPKDIGRALLVGLVLAALISALVPEDYFSDLVPPGIGQMLVLMAVGIPVYVCATASIPLAYALILTGVSPGAAFAFLMTGPATNAATIATLWKVMGKRTTAIYLGTMVVSALVGGLLLDQLVTLGDVRHAHGMGWMLPGWAKSAAAVVLLMVLGYSAIHRGGKHGPAAETAAMGYGAELSIRGMTCSHCAESVRRALADGAGVTSVKVDLDTGTARVAGGDLDLPALCQAVRELGYEAEIKTDPQENRE